MKSELLKSELLKSVVLLIVIFVAVSASSQTTSAEPGSVDTVARQIAGASGRNVERTQRLVIWINTSFEWTATDYQQRTAEQIIARRGGNCAELSRVLARLLNATGIRYRWVAEINIQPESTARQNNAAKLVAQRGSRASVFGLRHNDHRWLEIYDDGAGEWVPADPAVGVVGVESWIRFRMALVNRREADVPAVAQVVKTMIVPIAVIASGADGTPANDRSDFYLVQAFNRAYRGKLSALPGWNEWVVGVHELAPAAAAAFAGKANLHEKNEEIVRLGEAYARLRQAAIAAGMQ